MPDHFTLNRWEHLRIRIDLLPACGIAWYYMQPGDRLCFTSGLLEEIKEFQHAIKRAAKDETRPPLLYVVLASDAPGVFNFGGDLDLFAKLIRARDRDGLANYAKACIDVLHANAVNLELPITTISLVQGQALGGGFEAALSSEVVIAERGTKLGFPEILFNLFPGMGAFQLLCERVSHVMAKRIIQQGDLYAAEELYELGIVDVLADPGEGESAVMTYIRRQNRAWNGYMHIQKVTAMERTFAYDHLMKAAGIWVDAAMSVSDRDIRKMEKLVSAQRRLLDGTQGVPFNLRARPLFA
jgi:DSF synthase